MANVKQRSADSALIDVIIFILKLRTLLIETYFCSYVCLTWQQWPAALTQCHEEEHLYRKQLV